MATLDDVAMKIISEQELVIGPLAWSEAAKVEGLNVQTAAKQVAFSAGDKMAVIDRLVAQYERLFGRASHEVCREAVATLVATMQPSDIPMSLRA